MQSKLQLEQFYSDKDPWNYKTTDDDKYRKEQILFYAGEGYDTALDIGAGEGWITKDLPAHTVYGIEISDNAAERFPKKVERIHEPEGKYDLVICTGMLYKQYDYEKFNDWILNHTGKRAVLSNIKSWEKVDPRLLDKVVKEVVFPYRQYEQHLMVLDFEEKFTVEERLEEMNMR